MVGLVEWPAAVTELRVVRTPAATADFFPTILELIEDETGVDELPARHAQRASGRWAIDGVSLLRLIGGSANASEQR